MVAHFSSLDDDTLIDHVFAILFLKEVSYHA